MDVDMADTSTGAPGSAEAAMNQHLLRPANLNNTSPHIPLAESQSTTSVGAGPLPTGWSLPTSQTGSSSSSGGTEFTKRRNWSKVVLDQLRDISLVLSPELRMQFISPSCELLTGFPPAQLRSQFLMDIVHPDDKPMVVREINEAIASRQQFRFFYRLKLKEGTYGIFEAFGHPHFNSGPCGGIFMGSRPYPTKNSSLLDSFLEHKIENERLMLKIEELKREEREEVESQDQFWARKSTGMAQSHSQSEERTDVRTDNDATSNYDGNMMPPPPKPSQSNTALTKQNLNEALAMARPYSINDKMARYEEASPLDHVEFLTGLRNGERSEGISTGAVSPALIRGDAGIAILADRENRNMNSDKKKKLKLADEYVCTDCGTLDSPEWRKGPQGPKTLCNACGCKYFR
jgi:hypothetical protein